MIDENAENETSNFKFSSFGGNPEGKGGL